VELKGGEVWWVDLGADRPRGKDEAQARRHDHAMRAIPKSALQSRIRELDESEFG